MIVFTDVATPPGTKASGKRPRASAGSDSLAALERELQQAREEAQTCREEMQTSQEELKSTNEELQSTNEELTTSKEEMQSLNEELQTVNQELQATGAGPRRDRPRLEGVPSVLPGRAGEGDQGHQDDQIDL